MMTLVGIIHVIVAVFMIVVILLQAGKGGGMGLSFGGSSQQFFGGHGAGGFLARLTAGAAITFMITAITLSIMGSTTKSVLGEPVKRPDASQNQTVDGNEATDAAAQAAQTPEKAPVEAATDKTAAPAAPAKAGTAPATPAKAVPAPAPIPAPAKNK
jgi:preprotein translocase subunit SecG